MSDLPDGWEWVFIGDVAQIQGGIQKQQRRRPVKNKYPFLRVANVLRARLDIADLHEVELFEGEFDKLSLRRGDLLVVEGNGSPGHIGRAARWNGEAPNAVHQNHLIRLRPESGLDGQYLEYLWNSKIVIDQLVAVAGSTNGLLTLSVSKLLKVRVPVPPIAEQHRIVASLDQYLSRTDAAARIASELEAKIDRYAARYVYQLTNDPASNKYKLSDIADVKLGRQRSPKNHHGQHMRPYIRAANVTWSGLALDDVKEMNFSDAEAETYCLRDGDIVLSEASGSASEVGKPAIWRGEIPGCCIQNTLIRVRATNAVPGFIYYFLRAMALNGEFVNYSRGVGIRHLGSARLNSWPIGLPPEKDQARIANELQKFENSISKLSRVMKRVRNHAEQLRQSLLREAFAGRLVPQDPDDEPASVLLERIRVERESASKTKPPRQKRAGKSRVSEAQQHDKGIDPSTPPPEAPGKGTQDALELDL